MAANDVILGHMITYLNDKGDWQLHNCFFECIVGVVAYLGWPAVCLVEPLLLQVGVATEYLSVRVVVLHTHSVTSHPLCHLTPTLSPHTRSVTFMCTSVWSPLL